MGKEGGWSQSQSKCGGKDKICCKFSGFQNGAIEIFIHLGYCALSLGACCSVFIDLIFIDEDLGKLRTSAEN
jgi:hypothetical protein